ncbi:CLUMA_CG021163, isoform A [Clunio marinus]|uniref:CLUMA_CG021163, isoform A n=1 Tax=Clunio marinus TaxID=568069 RepID=A0A1J1J7S9_9DIPT|nr:CLUMA_CG021163, isoform A [Clunio marinus]
MQSYLTFLFVMRNKKFYNKYFCTQVSLEEKFTRDMKSFYDLKMTVAFKTKSLKTKVDIMKKKANFSAEFSLNFVDDIWNANQ